MKFIFFLLLTVSAVMAKHVCKPRSQFKDYCNTCACSDDGLSFGCTRMMCDKKIWNPDGTLKVIPETHRFTRSVEESCEPRSEFKEYCNSCVCMENGLSSICTEMKCNKNIWNRDGTVKVIPNSDIMIKSETPVCKPLSQFKDYCNSCTCSNDGLFFACTQMMCDENLWNEDGTLKDVPEIHRVERSAKQVCKPKTQFKNYCNTCGCSDDGLSFICTRMMCDENLWNKDGTSKVDSESHRIIRSPKQICKPRSQFKDYCNTCACSDDGLSYGCTRMMCDRQIWNPDGTLKDAPETRRVTRSVERVCEPRTQFKKYCNTCGCADDGLSFICTRMTCDETIWNQDGSLKIVPDSHRFTRSAVEQVCTPRSQLKNYCNTCICSEDGLAYACTEMMCDKNIWNKDGTQKILSV